MSTFARLVSGAAVDVVVTPPTLAERFNAEWLAQHTFYAAPDGTLPGRPGTLNGGGTVDWGANPTPPPPPGPTQKEKESAGQESSRGITRARAAALNKQGKYAEATALLLSMINTGE